MKQHTQTFAPWWRYPTTLALCAIVLCLASCASSLLGTTGNPSGQPTATNGTPQGGLHIGDAQNGGSATLHPGDMLTLELSLTTWTVQGSSNPQVLAQVGSPVVSPAPFNKTTCPYGGCGTVTALFRAIGPGTANVSASRDSCGEAMGCTGAAAKYQVTIAVTAA